MNELESNPKLSRLFRMQWEEAQSGYVLLYPEGMVKLNESAAEILKRCDGTRNLHAIVLDLQQKFGETGIEDDVKDFLREANARGWLA